MCRDVETNAKLAEPPLIPLAELHGATLERHDRELGLVREDLLAIANRIGMGLPSADLVMEARHG